MLGYGRGDRPCSRPWRCWCLVSSPRRGESLQSFEGEEDRAGPGPVGGELQRLAAGVAGELAGDVEDPVAQPFGLAHAVFAVETQ
jgi:hypothetical protein